MLQKLSSDYYISDLYIYPGDDRVPKMREKFYDKIVNRVGKSPLVVKIENSYYEVDVSNEVPVNSIRFPQNDSISDKPQMKTIFFVTDNHPLVEYNK
jgi:hypothetical protein